MKRTIAIGAVALALSLYAVIPAGAAEAGHGTSRTAVDLATLSVEGLTVALTDVSLGAIDSYASTDPSDERNALGEGDPFALARLALPVGDDLVVRSDGDTGRPAQTINLPGTGSLAIGDLSATVTDGEAAALVNALQADIDAALAGITVAVPNSGVGTLANSTVTTATNGAVIRDVSITIGDIVPLDILEQLPLSVVLDLLDSLEIPLDLPVDLTDVLDQIQELVDQLGAVETLNATIDTAQAQLAELAEQLDAALDAVADLEAAIAELEAALDAANGAVDAAEEELAAAIDAAQDAAEAVADAQAAKDAAQLIVDALFAACALLPTQPECVALVEAVEDLADAEAALQAAGDAVDTAEAALATATDGAADLAAELAAAVTDLADAQALVDTLNGAIDDLQATIDDLLAQLDELLTEILTLLDELDLGDLTGMLRDLIAGLAGTELLAVDSILAGVTTTADVDSSHASALCSVGGVRVLGQDRDITACSDLQGALNTVAAEITTLLDGLPLVSDLAGNVVQVQAPSISSSPANQKSGDYYTASSGVEGLTIQVLPVELTQVTDGVVDTLTTTIDTLLGDLPVDIDTAVLEEITAVLESLLAELEGLPAGDALAGLRTPSLGVQALDLSASSEYTSAGSAQTPPTTPTTPTTPGTPGTGTPGTGTPGTGTGTPGTGTPGTGTGTPGTGTGSPRPTTPTTTLPRTGAGLGGLALALLAVGGAGSTWLRRRDQEDPTL